MYTIDFINRVIFGECSEVMSGIPDLSIDLTVTSPPYASMREYNGYQFSFETVALQLFRVTAIGGVLVWVVGDETRNGSESGESFRQALHFKELGFLLHDTMIFEKNHFSNPSRNRYHQSFEYMFVFSKGRPKTFNPIKDLPVKYGKPWGTTSARNQDGSLSQRVSAGSAGVFGMRKNIWRYTVGNGFKNSVATTHPATFPDKLAEDHILSWSNAGDVVLDPMCGSGTTLRVARNNHRRFIGIDISQEYVDMSLSSLGML